MKRISWIFVLALLISCLAGCGGGQSDQSQKAQNYENETLGFHFEIPKVWKDDYQVNEHSENNITYTDFIYTYGWNKKKTTLLVSIIATDETTWTTQQLENEYSLMAISKEGTYFANKVPLVPEDVPFEKDSKKAKEFQKLLLSTQEVGKMFSLTK